MIQLGALAYGIYLTYNQRPVAVVLIDDFVVPATMEHYGGSLSSASDLHQYSDERPPIIYAEMPFDKEAMAEVNRIKLEERILEHAQVDMYRSQDGLLKALQRHQSRAQFLLDRFEARADYERWLRENGKAGSEIYIDLFSGRYGAAWLVFDLQGKYISYFLNPEQPENNEENAAESNGQ